MIRIWTVGEEKSVNCGSQHCKQGCWGDDGKTNIKPHGPYYTLFRRVTDKASNTVHERIRIGTFKPSPEQLTLINEKMSDPIPAEIWNDKPQRHKFVRLFRKKLHLLLLNNGANPDEVATIIGKRSK